MTTDSPTPENAVRHDEARHRFEIGAEAELAVLDYELTARGMILTHTFVPPALRGKGLAEKLVRAALARAEQEGRKVIPQCSYAAVFIGRHPEFQRLVAG